MARAQATTDHNVIRRWIETHNGHPSVVRATQGRKKGSAGLLRVDFDEPEESLAEIGWDDFFDTFDQNELAFLYQDEKESRFFKFVSRDSVDEGDPGDEDEQESSTRRSAKSAGSSRGDGASKPRQASPAEEEEAEEIDEEDVEEDEDEDEAEEEDEKPSRGKKR